MKTMDTPRREVADVASVQTPAKKLRQALLPFQAISPVGVSSASKKRKLSDESDVKVSKSLRTEKQNVTIIDLTETKENVNVQSQKHEVSSDSTIPSNVEKPIETLGDSVIEEESICLKLDSPTLDSVESSKENGALSEQAMDVDSVASKEENSTSDQSDKGDQVEGDTSLEKESFSEDKEVTEVGKTEINTGDRISIGENVSFGDSDAKGSRSESDETSEINSSAPSLLPTTPNQPVAVPKRKLLSSKKKEQREKVKQELDRKNFEKKREKEQQKEDRLLQKKRELQEKKEQLQKRLSQKIEEKQRREEERNQKKKQKEEEKQKKEEERQKKEEEKQKKEEEKQKEKQKKEEERLKKEEEKLKKEEEKLKKEEKKKTEEEEEQKKKEKAAAAFVSFFVPKKNSQAKGSEEQQVAEEKFMPFMVKGDMRLAPIVRGRLTDEAKRAADAKIAEQSEKKLYLKELTEKNRIAKTFSCTWPFSELKDEVVVIEDEEEDVPASKDGLILDTHSDAHLRAKLLQFCENQRPPYWGTWRKKSSKVRPRRPFNKDEKYFDYEVDSDDEWVEEEPGESLHGSDDEKESEDEYEVDNEFFVPHGYLSDEEAIGDEADDNVMSPETQKAKLKLLGLEFEEEMKQKTKQIKPQLVGCFWVNDIMDEHLSHQYEKIFMPYKATVCHNSIPTSFTMVQNSSTIGASGGSQLDATSSGSVGRKRSVFPEDAIPDLIRLVHGNSNSHKFLVMEFFTHWKKKNDANGEAKEEIAEEESPKVPKNRIAKLTIVKKIKELASWTQWPEPGPYHGKYSWYIPAETRAQFNLTDLPLPNNWKYNLKPKKHGETKAVTSLVDASPSSKPSEVSTESLVTPSKKPHLITKFTKVLSKEERLKQLKHTPRSTGVSTSSCSSNPVISVAKASLTTLILKPSPVASISLEPKVRKRVPLLVSVPRGQEIPRGHSLSSFLKPSAAPAKNESGSLKEGDKEGSTAAGASPSGGSSDAAKNDAECITLD